MNKNNKLNKIYEILFSEKNIFIFFQLMFWFTFFVFHISAQIAVPTSLSIEKLGYSFCSAASGLFITWFILKFSFTKLLDEQNVSNIILSLSTLIIASMFMTAFKAMIYSYLFGGEWLLKRQYFFETNNIFLLLLSDYFANAFLLLIWLIIFFVVYYRYFVSTHQDKVLDMKKLAISSKLIMLRYQLNPHFLFNTLNAISTLLLTKKSEQAYEMIISLSKFLRRSLNIEATILVSLKDELDHLFSYLKIEKIRFGEGLEFENNINEKFHSFNIPPMLIQPIVENSLKYSITKNNNKGKIVLNALEQGSYYIITIDDSGEDDLNDEKIKMLNNKSFVADNIDDEEDKSGIGLLNVKQRLYYIYEDNSNILFSRSKYGGLRVAITLPKKYDIISEKREEK